MLQALVAATPPVAVQEVKSVDELRLRKHVTVPMLQDEIILCERILKEAKDRAEKTKERLRADITEWKDMATKIEAVLWEEILLARSSAVAELEVWKHSATQAKHRSVQPP